MDKFRYFVVSLAIFFVMIGATVGIYSINKLL